MYSEWASLQQELQSDSENVSVLQKFPGAVGREVASSVVKTLARNLSMASRTDQTCTLFTEKDVDWTMEILCYSLSLPLSDGNTVIECVNVYCEWLSAFMEPKVGVPSAIQDDPNTYGQLMLQHLQNLFVSRQGSTPEQVSRQAVHCHRVLRVVQAIAINSKVLTSQTWDCLLKFLLAINDSLLGPPPIKDSLGDQICDRAVSVMFEVLLLACHKSFPSPPMWRTFRDMCAQWRHHEALVLHWHQVNIALLARVNRIMYGQDHPTLNISEDDMSLIPEGMSDECVAQCWFRLLHIIQNPVDLARPAVICNTPKFLHHALTYGVEAEQHPCLTSLPHIFHQAMRSLSVLLDASLGLSTRLELDSVQPALAARQSVGQPGSTPPPQRKSKQQGGNKGYRSTGPTTSRNSSVTSVTSTCGPSQLNFDLQSALAPTRPKVNSLLHLYGAWLIEAALVGVRGPGTQPRDDPVPAISRSRTTSFHLEHTPGAPPSGPPPSRHSTHLPDDISVSAPVVKETRDLNEAGRAEACGALCRAFCSKRTGEKILPEYLSRFYFALYHGLDTEQRPSGTVLTSIICNSCDLLRLDLEGVMMLLPRILTVLELILPELMPKFKHDDHIGIVDLRKASIHLLLSMLCLPLHFKTLAIKPLLKTKEENQPVTFASLKLRMMELLLKALTVETESSNTQMLLGGLLLCVQDLALCEEAEQTMHQEECDSSDIPSSVAPDTADSAQGLFCHAASIVSNRLLASWKLDLNVALAAIEVLCGLAKVRLNRVNFLMGKRTVNWTCEFILYQCSRPAPFHSKDLHSMIVAAFHCLGLWLVEHSYLMNDKECLQGVLEVLELGISGAKSQETWVRLVSQTSSPRSPPGVRRSSPSVSRKPSKHDRHGDKFDVPDRTVVGQNRASDPPKLKGDKTLKPVSLRVKDAAEGLLTVLMDHTGCFPPPCGPESLCSLLNETSLLSYCKDGDPPDQAMNFKYFVVEGSTIIGLYEQPLGNNQDPLPTVTALIRGPFGRHAWTMQLRHEPRSRKAVASKPEPTRPNPVENLGKTYSIQHRSFPAEVDQVPLVQADRSISKLESSLQDQSAELERFKTVILNQAAFEENVKEKLAAENSKLPFPNPDTSCEAPSMSHELQTARLLLSHYGFLNLESLKSPANSSRPPPLVKLRPGSLGLIQDLTALDTIPSRPSDTVHVFYVRSGQSNPQDILSNVVRQENVNPTFLEFLRSLGWPVDVRRHAGWTGHVSTSWKIDSSAAEEEAVYPGDTGGSLYDGQKQVLYWADVSTEMAFVVPSPITYAGFTRTAPEKSPRLQHSLSSTAASLAAPDGSLSSLSVAPSTSDVFSSTSPRLTDSTASLSKFKSASLDLEGPPPDRPPLAGHTPLEGSTSTLAGGSSRRFGRGGASVTAPETKVLVVWLESYEDWQTFPSGDLLPVTTTGIESPSSTSSVSSTRQVEQAVYIIYIHTLQNGLFRIHMQGQVSKMSLAIPLVDGMVVSRRSLGTLVRQTASNICRRKRLESDAYQPPHLRRKLKITDIVEKYACDMTESEFYTSLFKPS